MHGLMMDYPLTIPAMLRRTEALFGSREVASRAADGSVFRYTYHDCLARARRLGSALEQLGLPRGSRVATLCWNHHQHLEAYLGVPSAGYVLHTLNARLPAHDLAYIMAHAEDRAIIVDEELLPLLARSEGLPVEHVIVVPATPASPPGTLDYESLIASAKTPGAWTEPGETDAAAMCYTSGTTGRPKGVVYSHRAIVLHSLGSALPDAFSLSESDTVLAAVPMFHANAWGLPYTAALLGCRQVLPRNALDPVNLLSLLSRERATFTAGVPTIWITALDELDRNPGAYDLSALRTIVVGGGACPSWMIQAYEERHGLNIITSWGMTEMTPVGTMGRRSKDEAGEEPDPPAERAKPGRPLPFVELRVRHDQDLMPWDGVSMGELEVRGPWVAASYHRGESPESFTPDGWFRTGDIVTIDPSGVLEIRDRAKDLIKSGGEWISSVALENALMGHPMVAEAAVIAVPHAQWQERPLAVVVLKAGQAITGEELRSYLGRFFPAWYLPDAVVFTDEIPRTGSGKIMKQVLRKRYASMPKA